MQEKININVSLRAEAYRLVIDIVRNGQLKEEYKERFEKITLELLEIVKDKKERVKNKVDFRRT